MTPSTSKMRVLVLAFFTAAACGGTGDQAGGAGAGPTGAPGGWKPVSPKAGGKATGTAAGAACTRKARRLSIDQLDAAIKTLFGGLYWKGTSRTQPNEFLRMATTLGKPNYTSVTAANNEPSMLIMKFLDDMAGNVCKQALARDARESDAAKRLLLREKDVDANLRFLKLKLHATAVKPGDRKPIALLRKLYDKALAATGKTTRAWEAVCVAMLTSPEFYLY